MRIALVSVVLAAVVPCLAVPSKPLQARNLIELAPRTNKHRGHYNPGGPRHHEFPHRSHRKEVHLRASRSETDDVSDEFLKAIKKANHGGTLVLKKGKQYVLGKKLDLTFLDDIHVQLDGQILVRVQFRIEGHLEL